MSTEVTQGCYRAPSPNTGGMEESEELPGEVQKQKERKVSGDVEEMGATCPLKAQHRRAKPG